MELVMPVILVVVLAGILYGMYSIIKRVKDDNDD
jgi:uncharacterized membrane protein